MRPVTSDARSSRPRRTRSAASAARPRDVDATKRRLVDAVGAILARDGFMRLGINAIADEARADKALIYRYFGGLPGLLEAYAEDGSFWPTAEEMAGGSLEALAAQPLVERWRTSATHYVRELRKRPATLAILAWELVERNEITARLEEVRERRGLELTRALAHDIPPGVDIPALAALFGSSIHYLLLRARLIRVFNGIDLRSNEGWERLEAAAVSMILGALDRAAR
ncbi:MAG: TetR/AcrR family transcriptional regulator [Polyangiaceae bacterium]|nr:TetR/AcrR family transcriptional regulator [Polyangiaceae bacterium]